MYKFERPADLWRHPGGHLLLGGLDLTLVPDQGQPLCGQWLLLQPSMSRALGPELSKMGKSEAFPNESSHSRHFWKWCRGAMRRVWGQSKWRHGLGCPNQMNEEQGVPGNDNRTRGERERESVLGNGLRWAKRAKKKKFGIPSSDCMSDRTAAV